jgi:hypothetical protein
MKKAILFIVLALFMITVSCGSDGGSSNSSSSGSTAVTIRLGQPGTSSKTMAGAVNSSAAIPSGITTIRVTVSADDMVTIIKEVSVAGESSVTIILDIPNGPDRHILVEALDASGNVLYSGEAVVNLEGEPLQLTIVMSPSCNLFVDPAGNDNSDCTDVNNPCRTISYTLEQTAGNVTVCIAAGNYDISAGETFPITLKTGVGIKCRGAGHSTVIDSRVIEGSSPDTIIGAAGASIEGCSVITGDNSVAISDNGAVITVNDCLIEGIGLDGDAFDSTGIYLTADSTVSNSTINNFLQGEGGGEGILVFSGNATIAGNSITGNDYGVQVFGGAPIVSGNNTLSCNNRIDLENATNGMINARNNIWDHATPEVSSYPDGCPFGVDICNSDLAPGSVDYTGSTVAASPCLEM